MKSKIFFLLVLLFALSTYNLYSQRASGPWSTYNSIYDVNTVETIFGQVRSVDKMYSSNNMSYGFHMTVYTTTGDISVHLGPGWFIENQVIQIYKDDNVTIKGSRVTYEGSNVIIAKEVIKEGQVLMLRDDNGYPLWSGRRVK